ncbi:MAG TPA: DUF6265 family protein [Bacteroidales bacterium]|nr:DUF6265 family protein [Bacteroidales bacterium]MDD4235373.1 DUF6265 family protein [Bacteroidales bacterium]HRW21515.1 DUF6265 family protein [Bacteroidales bacterium]HXK82524.1 DUF6265 family protein [Bacteroidales bacterium]
MNLCDKILHIRFANLLSKKLFFVIVPLLLFNLISSLSFAQCKDFPFFLEGTWEIENTEGLSYEEWQLSSDSILVGRTYRLFGNDTIFFEGMEIRCYEGKPCYFMNAMMNNARVRAGYLPIQITNNVWVWENKHPDFPKTISYQLINDTLMSVWFKGAPDDATCVDFLMQLSKP